MKKLLIIALAIIGLNIQAQEAKTYAVKSGYIKYQLGGSTKGTKELWWDDYGRKTCETEKSTTTTKMFGIKNTEEKHSTTVIIKDKFWVADYIDNLGSKGTVPMYNEGQEIVGQMTEKEQEEFADEVLAGMGGKKIGTESLKGYQCDVIKLMGIKLWIYKGLILKSEGKILGIETNEMFVEFNPNSNVVASKFNPPSGVEYENLAKQSGAQGLLGAFGGLSDFEEEEDDSYEMVPVDYPYDKFKKVIADFNYKDYSCKGTNSIEGMHASTFMSGMNSIMVMAQAKKNVEMDKSDAFVKFKHNGHTCYYGKLEDEEDDNGTALFVDYPSHDMYIMIVGMPELTKNELLDISNKLDF